MQRSLRAEQVEKRSGQLKTSAAQGEVIASHDAHADKPEVKAPATPPRPQESAGVERPPQSPSAEHTAFDHVQAARDFDQLSPEAFMDRYKVSPTQYSQIVSATKEIALQSVTLSTQEGMQREFRVAPKSSWEDRVAYDEMERHRTHPNAYDVNVADQERLSHATDPSRSGFLKAAARGAYLLAGDDLATADKKADRVDAAFSVAAMAAAFSPHVGSAPKTSEPSRPVLAETQSGTKSYLTAEGNQSATHAEASRTSSSPPAETASRASTSPIAPEWLDEPAAAVTKRVQSKENMAPNIHGYVMHDLREMQRRAPRPANDVRLPQDVATGEAAEAAALKPSRENATLFGAKTGAFDAHVGGKKIINSEAHKTNAAGYPIIVRDVTLMGPDDAIQIKTLSNIDKSGRPVQTPVTDRVARNVLDAMKKAYNQPRTQARASTPLPGTNIYERTNVQAPKKITIIVQVPGAVTPEMIQAGQKAVTESTMKAELPPIEVIVQTKQ